MPAPPSSENLALIYQEALTATVRLRSNRQAVSDAESFRANTREALRVADAEGRRRGYSDEELQLARFAAVAFLDESVLNSRNPVFADWPRKPLQEELFGVHVAGEIFFRNVERLLKASDSPSLADVLEVYLLCLLLAEGMQALAHGVIVGCEDGGGEQRGIGSAGRANGERAHGDA